MRITAIYISIAVIIAILTLSGCSDKTHPDNPEPILTLLDAADISRTEARITAEIDLRGSTGLTYARLTVNETDTNDPGIEIEGDPDRESQLFHLTGLTPGKNYTCILYGGTATATLFSNRITFTTLPNELPKVSAPVPLSTGPLAIIVRFIIIDDGGEVLTEAGCEVKEEGSSEGRRIFLSHQETSSGERMLNITGLTPSTTYSITPFASNSIGEAYGEPLEYTTGNSFVLEQAGMLDQLLPPDTNLEKLTISGPMNGYDFRLIRTILGESEARNSATTPVDLNLSDAVITAGGTHDSGSNYTVADEISTGLLAGCTRLRHAILPNNVIRIARDAFTGSHQLQSVSIGAATESIIPSVGCGALEAINISEANTRFRSIDGVLFNYSATEIIWFPCGKSGSYTLPTGITSIGENAFAGTSISGLIIPASVTTIRRGAFLGSSLKEIIFPDNLANISEGLMQNCTTLTDVRLGSGTEYIGDFVFDGTSISDLWVAATLPPYTTEKAFADGNSDIFSRCTLHVPTGSKKLYRNHNRWGRFGNIEEFQP